MHTHKATTLFLAATAIAACADSPAEPVVDQDTEAQFLIGQSPLQPVFSPILDEVTGVLIGATIQVGIELSKGIINAAAEDRFLVRSDIDFTTTSGADIATLATKDAPVSTTDPEDETLRKGGTAPFDLSVEVSDEALLALLLSPGEANANADVSLVMTTGSGAEKVIDGTTASGLINPKTQPIALQAEPAKVVTTEDANGIIAHSVIVELYMPTALADAIGDGKTDSKGSAEFSLDGTFVFLADPRPSPVIDLINQGGGVSLVVIATPITQAEWGVIDAAVVKDGDVLDIVQCINLVLPDTGSGEVTLMTFESTGTTDPKVDGLPTLVADDGSGK